MIHSIGMFPKYPFLWQLLRAHVVNFKGFQRLYFQVELFCTDFVDSDKGQEEEIYDAPYPLNVSIGGGKDTFLSKTI